MDFQNQSNQLSSLQVKRGLFHDKIRKQQLDQYRRKKRQQLFCFGLNNQQNQRQRHQPKQKRKLEMFMLEMWAQRLRQYHSLDLIYDISRQLEKMELKKLADLSFYVNNEFQTTTNLLRSMLQAWLNQQLQHNINFNCNLQSNQLSPLLSNLQQLFTSIINQQDYIESQINLNKKRRIYFVKILQKKDKQPKNIDLKKIQQHIREIDQKQLNVRHPLERCWPQIRKIVEILGEVTVLLCKSEGNSNNNNENNQNINQPTSPLLTQCEQLFTIISLISHPSFTPQLISLNLNRIQSLQYLSESTISKIIESLYNFVTLQNVNQNDKNGKSIVKHDTNMIIIITKIFSMALKSFNLTSDDYNHIVKSLTHLFSIYQQAYMPIFIDQNNILKQLLQPYINERQQVINLWKILQKKQISPDQFIEKYVQLKIPFKEKIDILILVGAIFNYVTNEKYYGQIMDYLSIVLELLHYEMRQLGKLNSAKMYEFKDSQFFNQKIPISNQQDIIEYTLFVLRNMFGVQVQICKGFIEKHGINDLLVIWQHMCWLEEMVNKDVTKSYTSQKLVQARRTKLIIVDCLYNITSMLTSQKGDRQPLSLFIEYKHSAVIKLLLHHIKSYSFNQELLYQSQNSDSLRYTLATLQKLFAFVLLDGYSLKLVDDLQHSGGQFGGEMMREMLTMVMMDEKTYGKGASERAEKCLQLVDIILKQCSLQYEQNGGRYYEQQHFMSQYDNNNRQKTNDNQSNPNHQIHNTLQNQLHKKQSNQLQHEQPHNNYLKITSHNNNNNQQFEI